MQVDEIYPQAARRNYRQFLDGFYRIMEEGALLRGAPANALKLAMLCSSMTGVYDYVKESSY